MRNNEFHCSRGLRGISTSILVAVIFLFNVFISDLSSSAYADEIRVLLIYHHHHHQKDPKALIYSFSQGWWWWRMVPRREIFSSIHVTENRQKTRKKRGESSSDSFLITIQQEFLGTRQFEARKTRKLTKKNKNKDNPQTSIHTTHSRYHERQHISPPPIAMKRDESKKIARSNKQIGILEFREEIVTAQFYRRRKMAQGVRETKKSIFGVGFQPHD